MAVEFLRFLALPDEAIGPARTDSEAHFIRLAIGRAVYASRLAYDEVPDSLQPLIKTGLMLPRYLSDENNISLRSRRDGDSLVVESTGPSGWKHS